MRSGVWVMIMTAPWAAMPGVRPGRHPAFRCRRSNPPLARRGPVRPVRGRSWYPMSFGTCVVDFEEYARVEGIHAGICQVAHWFGRFLGELGHETRGIDLYHAAARRVLGTEHGQGCLGIASAVEVDQASQVEVRQVVGIERQEELLVLHPNSVVTKGAGTAQELLARMPCGWPEGRAAPASVARRCREGDGG